MKKLTMICLLAILAILPACVLSDERQRLETIAKAAAKAALKEVIAE